MKDLEQEIKRYYLEQSLPENKASRMLTQAEHVRPSFFARPVFSLTVVVAAMILVGSVLLWVVVLQRPGINERIIAEMMTAHQHSMSVEVVSDRYDELQAKLSQLTFSIVPTQPHLLEDFELLGGRYCDINGKLAAQLKVKERRSGMICTVYVTPLTSDLQSIKPATIDRDGLMIELWKDQDRLFGLTGEISL